MAAEISVHTTPNPNSKKFVIAGVTVAADTQWFGSAGEADANPIASALFGIDGVANVMMLNDFVTIGKTASGDWASIESAAKDVLSEAF